MGLLSGIGKVLFGDTPGASREASQADLAFKQQGLDYAKAVDAPLIDYRNRALSPLFGFYDPTNPQGQQQFIDQAQSSPFYQRQQQVGEEAILRNQAATGGLRSGGTQRALAGFNADLLNQTVNQNLAGLGSFVSPALSTNSISQQYSNLGTTAGQGIIGEAQAEQALAGQTLNLAGQIFGGFSDKRLKKNIKKIGTKKGANWYSWEWNEKGNELGLFGGSEGVIADEFKETNPELLNIKNGYLHFNYGEFLNG